MKNYLKEFMETKGRRPTEAELGQMMHMSAIGTAGAKKNDYIYGFGGTWQNKGGKPKTPIKLSENGIKINLLLNKAISRKDIATILDLDISTVRNLIHRYRLPRNSEQII